MAEAAIGEKKSRKWLWIVLAVIGLLIIMAMAGGDDTEAGGTATATPSEPAMNVSSVELAQAYETNEMAAQQQYGDRSLAVTGTVQGIDLDLMDEPVLMLNGTNEFMNVQAKLADESHQAAASISKGDEVTVTCTELTEIMGTPMLDGCTV